MRYIVIQLSMQYGELIADNRNKVTQSEVIS